MGEPFQVCPEFVSTKQQGHVRRMLEIGLPNHPGLSVARSEVMGRRKFFKPENALPSGGQMESRGTAHSSKPKNNDVGGIQWIQFITKTKKAFAPATPGSVRRYRLAITALRRAVFARLLRDQGWAAGRS